MLQPADLALIRDLLAVLGESGVPCFLIGAGARVLGLDERFGISGARATLDWDFAVRVGSWEEWRLLHERLVSVEGMPFQATGSPHRFRHREGRLLDLVPYGGLEDPAGSLEWPDGSRMSVWGFDEAADRCEMLEVAPGLHLQVACLPSLALLKLHGYLDRRARGVRHDIQDLDWLLRHYDALPAHEDRAQSELREPLLAGEIEYSEAGAMLLGSDAARMHGPTVLEPLAGLLAELGDPYGRPVQDVLQARRIVDEAQEEELRARVLARFRAFRHGLAFGSEGGGA